MPYSKLIPEEMNEGAGARVRRLFPASGRNYLDPFVLFDDFSVTPGAGFPDHPHRGFEAITYMLTGAMHHHDSLGNDGVVGAGGALRFTAGSGIVHSEMPEGSDTAHGIQLWVNLARAEKSIDASYQQVSALQVPESKVNGFRVRTVVGPGSPLQVHTPMMYLDVELAPGSEYSTTVPPDYTGIVYVIEGEVQSDGVAARKGEALSISPGDVSVRTGPGARYLLVAGRPHGEPAVLHGTSVD